MCAQILALLEKDGLSQEVVASLTKAGHTVMTAESFGDAIHILQGLHPIDLVISDVHLENGGNVFDFLRWVNDHPSAVGKAPFVLFSCNPSPFAKHLEDGLRITSRMLGAAQYISMDRFETDKFSEQIGFLLPQAEYAMSAPGKPNDSGVK
jgi:CheY-like chemotaxis protein